MDFLAIDSIKHNAARWGLIALITLCVAGIGLFLAKTIWLAVSGVERPIQIEAQAKAGASTANQFQLSTVQEWHLFGQKSVATEPEPQTREAPKTTLKLELLGVFLGTSGAVSTAIIGEIGKTPESYREGATIARGVVLKEVHADRVILSRSGRYETLAFSEKSSSSSSVASMPPASPPRPASQRFADNRRRFLNRGSTRNRANVSQAAPQSQLGRMVQSGNAFAPDAIVDALKNDLEQDPQAALKDMGLVSTPGASGYVIGANAPTDLLKTVGLRVGDRVMSVGGQSISGSPNDAAIIQNAMSQSNVRVEVQRGTRTFTVNVPVP